MEHHPPAGDAEDCICNVLRSGVVREIAGGSLLEDFYHLPRGGIVAEDNHLGLIVDHLLDSVSDGGARQGI